MHTDIPISLNKPYNDILQMKSSINQIESVMNSIENVLDESIYSHKHAKNQIMKIIAQWMNGEQTGYCFGFEGCPGIGKTSLAKKGLSNCLKDDNGEPRPFAFIALGGSSNGSMLEGHGYTYLNSSWGRIVDILMETKCMNPIIYIDELDKVSKTENGKEIIGIFTHLIDSTQNDKFQDKYYSGIDIDLSKALFIFSYNDPDQIDRVLLDRIHRIKFDNLTLNDKLVIVRKFIIPEINKKMGFENIVEISDEVIEFIILNYTMEPGVRKLKEIFFDLFGEINLSMLKTNFDTNNYDIPIIITKENIENNYLKKYDKIKDGKIKTQLYLSGPTKYILWRAKIRNTDITNWNRNGFILNYSRPDVYSTYVINNYFTTNIDIITHTRIMFNGNVRQEGDTKYFNSLMPYEGGFGDMDIGGYLYSFALYPTLYQPSGTANLSMIEELTLEHTINPYVINFIIQ